MQYILEYLSTFRTTISRGFTQFAYNVLLLFLLVTTTLFLLGILNSVCGAKKLVAL